MKFGIALIEKDEVNGLSKEEINLLLDKLDENSVYPLEIFAKEHESVAMGFITENTASELHYEYFINSELHEFVAEILDDMEKENENHIYNFNGINIWLSR